jgi:REP element-mobilizing transposase RayT
MQPMSRKYKFRNPEALYFVTFATVNWIDVFIRRINKDILVDSLNYCIANKGLVVYAWVVMSNHVHLVIERRGATVYCTLRPTRVLN